MVRIPSLEVDLSVTLYIYIIYAYIYIYIIYIYAYMYVYIYIYMQMQCIPIVFPLEIIREMDYIAPIPISVQCRSLGTPLILLAPIKGLSSVYVIDTSCHGS